jgi:hypothetical protein
MMEAILANNAFEDVKSNIVAPGQFSQWRRENWPSVFYPVIAKDCNVYKMPYIPEHHCHFPVYGPRMDTN